MILILVIALGVFLGLVIFEFSGLLSEYGWLLACWLLSLTCVVVGTLLAISTGHALFVAIIGIPAFVRASKISA